MSFALNERESDYVEKRLALTFGYIYDFYTYGFLISYRVLIR